MCQGIVVDVSSTKGYGNSIIIIYTPPAPIPLSVISAVYPLFLLSFSFTHYSAKGNIMYKKYLSL